MIIEMRSYPVKPGTVAKVEEAFEKALPGRTPLSPLAAFWHTEIGELNRVIHVWPYADEAERERVRAEATKVPGWPPAIKDYVIEMESEVFKPAPFSPALTPRQLGNVYEIRIYSYKPGSIPMVIERWGEKIEWRARLSPLVGCWYSDTGPLHNWVHIWAYKDAGERTRIREESHVPDRWPAKTNEHGELVKQKNMLVVPARFSPLH